MIDFDKCAVIAVCMRSGATNKASGPLGFEVLVYGRWTSELEQIPIRLDPALIAIERLRLDVEDYQAPMSMRYNIKRVIRNQKGLET